MDNLQHDISHPDAAGLEEIPHFESYFEEAMTSFSFDSTLNALAVPNTKPPCAIEVIEQKSSHELISKPNLGITSPISDFRMSFNDINFTKRAHESVTQPTRKTGVDLMSGQSGDRLYQLHEADLEQRKLDIKQAPLQPRCEETLNQLPEQLQQLSQPQESMSEHHISPFHSSTSALPNSEAFVQVRNNLSENECAVSVQCVSLTFSFILGCRSADTCRFVA